MTTAHLADLIARTTLLWVAAWLAACAFRKASASVRNGIWTIALLAAVALPFLDAIVPMWTLRLNPAAALLTTGTVASGQAVALRISSFSVSASASSMNAARWIFMIWIAGAGFVLIRLLSGLVLLKLQAAKSRIVFDEPVLRLVLDCSRAMGVSRAVRILASQRSDVMPVTWGVFRPHIFLPSTYAEWSPERLRLVLTHELAHVRRFDWVVRISSEIICALYWFHPLAWFVAARLRAESERACDDAVLEAGEDPSRYAGTLLDLVRLSTYPKSRWAAALAMARPGNLERRFIAMLDSHVNRRRLTPKSAALTGAVSLAILIALASVRLPAQDGASQLSGSVVDASGAAVPNATIIVTNVAARTKDMTVSDAAGAYRFNNLPAGEYEMEVTKPGFALYKQPGLRIGTNGPVMQNAALELGKIKESVTVEGQSGGSVQPLAPEPARIKVGGNVRPPEVIYRRDPVYPPTARSAGIQGTVLLEAVISTAGDPLSIRVMNSQIDPDLARAAVEAVNQWRFKPALLNGAPVEVVSEINVNFTLAP